MSCAAIQPGAHRLADRRKQTSFVWTDNGDIGEKGARFLMSLSGFAVYAFVGDRECNFWSTERARAFRDCIVKAGNPCQILDHSKSLVKWLAALPKPAAIMASHDLRAAEGRERTRRRQTEDEVFHVHVLDSLSWGS